MTKSQRTTDKVYTKKFLECYKPSETVSHDKKGWYSSEIDYKW